MSQTLYLSIEKNVEVSNKKVTLGDISSMWCKDKTILAKCKAIHVLTIKDQKSDRVVYSIMKIIKMVQELDGSVEVVNMGETDFIIDYKPVAPPNYLLQWLKTACVAIIAFCGAAFAIMTFNNDGSVSDIFGQLYELVMGVPSDGFTVMEVSYSIGLALGIIIFFNHFKWKTMLKDPTPIEVKMRIYEDEVNTALIQVANREGTEIDVE